MPSFKLFTKSVEKLIIEKMKYIYYEIGRKKRTIESKGALTLKRLQELVGGNIEFFPLKDETVACVNEEGIILHLPVNPAITENDTEVDIAGGVRGNILLGKVRADGEFIGVE